MVLNALVKRLKHRAKDDFKGRHFEATLILQAVSWCAAEAALVEASPSIKCAGRTARHQPGPRTQSIASPSALRPSAGLADEGRGMLR